MSDIKALQTWRVVIILSLFSVNNATSMELNKSTSTKLFDSDYFVVGFDPAASIMNLLGHKTFSEYELITFVNKTHTRFRQVFIESDEVRDTVPVAFASFNQQLLNKSSIMRVWLQGKPIILENDMGDYQGFHNTWEISELTRLSESVNSIYPGTVQALLLDFSDYPSVDFDLVTELAQELWTSLNGSCNQCKIGVILSSEMCTEAIQISAPVNLVVFSNIGQLGKFWSGGGTVDSVVEAMTQEMEHCQQACNTTEAEGTVDFALRTSCPSKTSENGTINFKNVVQFWHSMNAWVASNKTTIIMDQAFDTPAKPRKLEQSPGWWRLVENASHLNASQFVFEERSDLVDSQEHMALSTILQKTQTAFNKERVIIAFDPLVAPRDDWRKHKYDHLDTSRMLKVVGGKFRRLHVNFETLFGPDYEILSRVPNAVAMFNKNESSGERNSHFDPIQLSVEMIPQQCTRQKCISMRQLKSELWQEPSSIFPDTVTTIVLDLTRFRGNLDIPKLSSMLRINGTKTIGIKVPLLYCFGTRFYAIAKWLRGSIDKIILKWEKPMYVELMMVDQVISWETSMFQMCKNFFLKENVSETVEFILETYWPDTNKNGDKNLFPLVNFWDKMNAWSGSTNNTVLFRNAFDTPYKPADAHLGWWSLAENDSYQSSSEYIFKEKKVIGLELLEKKKVDSENEDQDNNSSQFIGTLELSLILVGVALIISSVLCFTCLWKRYWPDRETQKMLKEFQEGLQESSYKWLGQPHPKLEMELKSNQFEIDESSVLGSGTCGKVCGAQLRRNVGGDGNGKEEVMKAVVKMPNSGAPHATNNLRSLLSDIKILAYLGPHENIVRLLGTFTSDWKWGRVYMFLEYCSVGPMDKYLRHWRNHANQDYENGKTIRPGSISEDIKCYSMDTFQSAQMYSWIEQILNGMSFLAEKKVVHADLATRNILLTADLQTKITDFGLSRRLYDFGLYVKKQGEALPWRWMAPESLRRLEFTEKTDVWSFGVTLWEIFSFGELPYSGILCPWESNLAVRLEGGLCLEKPIFSDDSMYEIMLLCWRSDQESRPTFATLKETLLQIQSHELQTTYL